MSERNVRNEDDAMERRLQLAVQLAGGTASLATLGTVFAMYRKRQQFKDTVRLYTDRLVIAESTKDERLARYSHSLRSMVASSLAAYPSGATPDQLRRLSETGRNSNLVIRELINVQVLDCTDEKYAGVRLAPNKGFVSAVIDSPQEVPRLLEHTKSRFPAFELAHLVPYSSDPEMAAASLGLHYSQENA